MPRPASLRHLDAPRANIRLTPRYVCPTCALFQFRTKAKGNSTRQASTLVSTTAVNARKTIPSHLKRLHGSLERLRQRAGNYVDLSRLQLAAQGLESERPRIRLAILGLGNQHSARRIAHLLAADPLEPRGQWEDALCSEEEDKTDKRSVLVKYGSEDEPATRTPLVRVMPVPSPFLQQNNLELLVTSLETPQSNSLQQSSLADSALTPLIAIPISTNGGVSMVRYPVHRALVLGDGLRGCNMLGKWNMRKRPGESNSQLQAAVNIRDFESQEALDFAVVDLQEAAEGLGIFRESTTNGDIYGNKWSRSGLRRIVEWVGSNRESQTTGIVPAVRTLLEDILSRAETKIVLDRSQMALNSSRSSKVPEQLNALNAALGQWAANSHSELQDRLERGFDSDEWARLKWYKLMWRVDDVEMILSRLLERFWLVDTEKRMIWLTGRATEARLLPEETALALIKPSDYKISSGEESTGAKDAATTVEAAVLRPSDSQIRHEGTPKYTGIEEERRWLKQKTVPELQRKAQALILQTLSFSGISGGASVLAYLTWPSAGVYGAGAFAALGLVWALRRLQKQWEAARGQWELQLQQQGQRVLKATEDNMRRLMHQGPIGGEAPAAGLQDIELAHAALQDTQAALDEVVLGAKDSR